jgi:hypothetical protein
LALRELVGEATTLGAPPTRVGKEEVDQINIIARWIHHHSDDDERAFFRLPRDLADTPTVDAFVARVTAVVMTPPPEPPLDVDESEADFGPSLSDEAVASEL